MDTSRKYYEDTILDFKRRRRGRSLCQFCKDEGIDYQWMKVKRKYSGRTHEEEDPASALKETYRLIAQGKRALANAMDSLEKDIREHRIGHAEATRRLDGIRKLEARVQGAWRSAEALLRKVEKHVE